MRDNPPRFQPTVPPRPGVDGGAGNGLTENARAARDSGLHRPVRESGIDTSRRR